MQKKDYKTVAFVGDTSARKIMIAMHVGSAYKKEESHENFDSP